MSVDYSGLTRNTWPGTWSPSSDSPIALDTELRGTLQSISGDATDRLVDIPGQRLTEGMLVYVKNGYTNGSGTALAGDTYYTYKLQTNESRNTNTGAVPNADGNWSVVSFGGSGSGGIALTDLSVGAEGTASGDGAIAYDNTTGEFTYTPPDLSGYLTSYTETQTLDDVITLGNTTTQTAVIPFYYAQQSDFPNATTYHGAIAHSHSDGAMYFAHAGNWVELANSSDLPTALTDLGISDGSAGQVLQTDGNGGFSFASVSSGGATALNGLSDVTLTSPTNGQVLQYNGTAWVNAANSGGIALTDLSVTTNSTGTAALSYDDTTGAFSYTPPDLSSYLQSSDIGSNVLAYDSNLQSFVTAFTLPTSDGSNGQVLTTDGNGGLSFSTVSGGSGSLTVSEISGSTISNEVTSVTALRFDNTTGFNVTDLGSGEVEISLGSSFKTLQVSGQSDLVAVGEDTLELVAGTGISITTNTSSTPKALTITATGSSIAQVLNNGDFSDNTSAVELTTTTANQTLDSFATADYRTAKYLIQAINGADVHSTEVFLTHDDNDVYITEYATIYTNTSLFTVSAEISGTNLNVIVTPTSANTTFDFVRTLIVARTVQSFEFEGDLQSLGGSATDLQSETGDTVDLNDIGLEGDLQSDTGSEDLNSGSGGTDLSS
jgi:hypothetical protein